MGEFCEKTRSVFGDLIQKPPLSDKLLSKPPFRFLHDVILAVIRNSGFLDGLYSEQESDSSQIKDKDGKIAILQKAIDAVQFATGETLPVRPGKVVAGQEPEKTNEFLQKLAESARATDSEKSQEIVGKVLRGEKLEESGGSAGSNKENRTAKTEGAAKKKKEKEKSSTPKSSTKDRPKDPKDKDDKKKHKSKDKHRESSKDKEKKSSSKQKKEVEAPQRENSNLAPSEPEMEKESSLVNGFHEAQKESMDVEEQRAPSPPSPERKMIQAEKPDIEDKIEEEVRPGSKMRMTRSARPPSSAGARPGTAMARPGTARAAPPRLKRREIGEIEQTQQRVDSASSQKETTNLIIGGQDDGAVEEEENYIVEEPIAPMDLGGEDSDEADADQLDAEEHGGLVRKILETKKELESGLRESREPERALVVFDEKEREKTRKDTTKLQETVQNLTKTAHPLSRLLDFMQEDIDSMIKELDQWRQELKQNLGQLRRMQVGDMELEGVKGRLGDLDHEIKQSRDAIAVTRGTILDLEQKLEKHIGAIVK